MGKTLVLAEKPSVGRDIARVLNCKQNGNGYIEGAAYVVTWALGHLVTLADPEAYDKRYEKWDLHDLPIIPQKLQLVVIGKTSKQFGTVRTLLTRKDIDSLVIATDAGREGELVARWILEKASFKKPIKRLWISSVTDKAIKEGFQRLKDGREYENLYKSAVARAQADWIVGINATRALTSKYNAQLSCGRVQTPTLSMIAKREDDIRNFVPKDFYGISLRANNVTYTWVTENGTNTFNQSKCDDVMQSIQGKTGEIVEISKTDKKTYPPLLYDLTQLQADANKIYGFSAKETLSTMQSLYESHKAVTYPRTDSKYISTDIVETLKERVKACSVPAYRKAVAKLTNAKFSRSSYFVDDKKVSDHHAIIPTEQAIYFEELNDKEKKIYDLVVKRFLSALCPPYEYEQTEITLKIGNEKFKARGRRVKSMGFKEIFNTSDDDTDDSQELPEMKKGQVLKIDRVQKTSGKTKPPSYFNEATLLLSMENPKAYIDTNDKTLIKTLDEAGGIGTVATRADIIEKLFNSFVIEKKGNDIFITQKGKQLLGLAPAELTSPLLTAIWEKRLQNIAQGKEKIDPFLKEISEYTKTIIQNIKTNEQIFRHDNITREKCPQCGKLLLRVATKKGEALVCQDRECSYRKNTALITNARCPICHKKLKLTGEGDKKAFSCVCGHKERYDIFKKRKESEASQMSKKEVEQYIKNQSKKEEPFNNAFAAAFAKLK